MLMPLYILKVKQQLRDTYGFTPVRVEGSEPVFENIPDGDYPMTIDSRLDHVRVEDNRIHCCNFGN